MSILSFTSFTKRKPGHSSRLKRMALELKNGFSFLDSFRCDRVVTFFGGAQVKRNQSIYKTAEKLASMLAKEGITIMTGGGPGIMEAGNKGAYDAGGRSAGLNIHLADQERKNFYVLESIGFHYFFARKIMLAYGAQACVFFPGGFGTMDEFFEISTLIVTHKTKRNIPMILVGKEYWTSLIDWMKKNMVEQYELLDAKRLEIWQVVDTAQEAFDLLKETHVDSYRCEIL